MNYKDRVKQAVTTGGTGALVLGAAVASYQALGAGDDGLLFPYVISDGSAWEVGYGTYTNSGASFARTTFHFSSTGSALNVTTAAVLFIDITATLAATYGASKTYGVFTPMTSQPPSSNNAVLDTRNSIAVLKFDAATEWAIFWVGIIPEAASLGSGLIVKIHWLGATATSGDVKWGAAFERMNTDLDADSFDTETTGTSTTNATSGIITVTSITCTTIDSVTAGDSFRIKIARKAADAADTMTGDAQIVSVEVRGA